MNEFAMLIRWALLTLGLIYFITESALFAPGRVLIGRLGTLALVLTYCASCTGFWVGVATAQWVWPFGVADLPAWATNIEGGVAAMALGALYSAWRGGNPAWRVEGSLHDSSQTKEEEPHAEG